MRIVFAEPKAGLDALALSALLVDLRNLIIVARSIAEGQRLPFEPGQPPVAVTKSNLWIEYEFALNNNQMVAIEGIRYGSPLEMVLAVYAGGKLIKRRFNDVLQTIKALVDMNFIKEHRAIVIESARQDVVTKALKNYALWKRVVSETGDRTEIARAEESLIRVIQPFFGGRYPEIAVLKVIDESHKARSREESKLPVTSVSKNLGRPIREPKKRDRSRPVETKPRKGRKSSNKQN